MAPRVLIAGVWHETNTFSSVPTDLDALRSYEYVEGEDLFPAFEGTNTEIGGMLGACAALGFAPDLIAGEEPELCVRLRRAGWKILRIDVEMSLHDAAMTRFSQWWRRMQRAGHAYAEGALRHGRSPLRHDVRELASALVWGMIVPAALVAATMVTLWWPPAGLVAAGLALGIACLYRRIAAHRRARGDDRHAAALYARFTVLGKLPLAWGALACGLGRLRRRRAALIEYK